GRPLPPSLPGSLSPIDQSCTSADPTARPAAREMSVPRPVEARRPAHREAGRHGNSRRPPAGYGASRGCPLRTWPGSCAGRDGILLSHFIKTLCRGGVHDKAAAVAIAQNTTLTQSPKLLP